MKKIVPSREQLEKMTELYHLGQGVRKIAEHLGMAKGVIVRSLEELGLPLGANRVFPKNKGCGVKVIFSEKQLKDMVELYHSGDNIYVIARKLDTSPDTVNRTLKKLGVIFRSKKISFTDQQIDQIIRMYERGDGLDAIGQTLGVVKTVIDRVLNELNLPTGKDRIFPEDKFIPGIKIEVSDEKVEKIIDLYDQGISIHQIADRTQISRHLIQRILNELNMMMGKDRVFPPKKQVLPTERECRTCHQVLPIVNFRKRERDNWITFEYDCITCMRNLPHQMSVDEYQEYKEQQRKIARELALEEKRAEDRRRRREDPFYQLRQRVSCVIWQYLNKTGGSKYGHSMLEYLPYTIPQLKAHLESLFESWMTWDNYGQYRKENWNDSDSTTWKWNIDHIIPHSTLPYKSMQDANFQKCWDLSNLRPYSAKQNLLDGINRVRHH
jgi:hypothetical protein